MKILNLIIKGLSIVTGAAWLAGQIPPKYAAVSAFVFALSSWGKDLCLLIGDYMDDKKLNGSFKTETSLPDATSSTKAGGVTGLLVAFGAASLLFVTGCTALDPGSRAIVVRTEQSLTVADSTFDTVVRIDNSHRQFFQTNAAAFHAFAEWLRQPVTLAGLTNSWPRGIAIIRSADTVKNAYKAQPTTNNYAALINSLATVEAATAQAQSWLLSIETPNQ